MTDSEELSLNSRRYSAVAVTHERLRSIADLAAAVEGMHLGSGEVASGTPGVTAVHAVWSHRQNQYPHGSALRRATKPNDDGNFQHRCFVAMIGAADAARPWPVFLFASPHVRVVGKWCDALVETLDSPRPGYITPRLSDLFEGLATKGSPLKATQITLEIPSGVDVNKVALTGKSPVISSLRKSLEPVTIPYGVRLELDRTREKMKELRFHLDRHGNYWWYQANEQALGVAAGGLASLAAAGYVGVTHDPPHKRVVAEEGGERNF